MFDVKTILVLAKRALALSVDSLVAARNKNGFQSFFFDLKDLPLVEGEGWRLEKGLLTVNKSHNPMELKAFLDSKLEGKSWYQKSTDMPADLIPAADASFNQWPFKVLGKFGENPAIDVAFWIQNEDGTLSLQVITRHDGTHAFVGGMVEAGATILSTCIDELIEELYSNDLFSKDSKTLEKAGALSDEQLQGALAKILEHKRFSKLAAIKPSLLQIFADKARSLLDKIEALEQTLKASGEPLKDAKNNPMLPAELAIFWVHIKCELYAELFPTEYQNLCAFLQGNLSLLDTLVNKADPRNTAHAHMVTTPHYLFVKVAAMQEHEAIWLVKASGGDDAIAAKKKDLASLFHKPMYSSHESIALTMLADYAEKDPSLLQSPAVQGQLEKIEQFLTLRETALAAEKYQGRLFIEEKDAAKSAASNEHLALPKR